MMAEYLYYYEVDDEGNEAWVEPVAYANEGYEEEEDEEEDAGNDAAGSEPAEAVKTGVETPEPVKRVDSRPAVSFVGTLDDALRWKPRESARPVRDVEHVEDCVEVVRAGHENRGRFHPLGYGWNCEVPAAIGELEVKVLLDGGASRNIIQRKFREMLMTNAQTRQFISGPYTGERTVSIAGIHSNQGPDKDSSKEIKESYRVRLQFVQGDPPRTMGQPVEVYFGEMASSSDHLLIGCPQLAEWGYSIWRVDGDDTPMVELNQVGVRLHLVKWGPNPELRGTISPGGGSRSSQARLNDQSR